MNLHQIEALAIVGGMFLLFISDRLRYDIVAAVALSAAVLTGVVPPHKAFSGFSSAVVIIIASVLVLSRAVAVSGVVEASMRRLLRTFDSTTLQVGALTTAVTFLSAVVKNVGALGLFLPVAIRTAEQRNRPVSRYLMPLAFGSLIGGTITQIGTSPNILISQVRQETLGRPYGMFDYTSIGLPLSLIAVVFLSMGWRLLPADRRGQPPPEKRFALEDYTSEVQLPDNSMLTGKTVADLEALAEGEVTVAAIIRDQRHRYVARPNWTMYAGDILVLEGDPTALQPLIDQSGLRLLPSRDLESLKPRGKDDDLEVAEAVVAPDSLMTGRTPVELQLRQNFEVNVLAVSRAGKRDTTLLRQKRFESGDVIVLQGRTTQLLHAMTELGLLPLAERHLSIGRPRRPYLPLMILAAAIVVVAARLADVEVVFFVAATLVVLLRLVPARMAYDAVDWPIIVMIGCLIPVGEALHDTGTASVLAKELTVVAAHLSGTFAVGLVLVVTMLVTPFLQHAAAVLVMGPVAATLAKDLGFSADPFLMAVAFGAACDFLTPVGHQNSTLVMRPGGYRFGDFWRLGLPLSMMVAVLGTWLIVRSWPLH